MGADVIQTYLKTLPSKPGVYRMINADGDVLYVGKAKNLRKRVANYTSPARLSIRIRRMVAITASMEFVTTHTEAEALLLEANLIKRLAPRYNILLRDDKSYPAILITGDHDFPQVLKHRGARKRKGEYFGPFASAGAVNQTLTVLQRAFLLRTCTDAVFSSRTRPCLLYQIKRCAGPCVDKISQANYATLVEESRQFLQGESQDFQRRLSARMQDASDTLDFEKAADYRDRIQALTRIQAHQDINVTGITDADIIAAHQEAGQTCIQVFFFRTGRNFGNRAYFPNHARDIDAAQVLEAFLGQFYADKQLPKLVLVSHKLENHDLVQEALSTHANKKVVLSRPVRGEKRKLIKHAALNARDALRRRMAESASQRQLLEGLARALDLDTPPERIEVYDNSHISGEKAVGGMIVAGPEGMIKNAYRKFNIRVAVNRKGDSGAQAGDDYAMMREVLSRRFSRALKEDPDRTGGQWPDLVLIDGGAGQLSVVREVFAELGIEDVALASIAKGPDRNAGRERFFLPDREPFSLDARDPVLYFLQRLRDEAHRFAIGAHRGRRQKVLVRSILDEIPG
ncbi:MAG: excinuclease ABC subunit UvrC, partial [Rhodospirillaceae bacterium]|nr:excinuclease ABC subunit UvrC [Rhodospirillaceae bacterium]